MRRVLSSALVAASVLSSLVVSALPAAAATQPTSVAFTWQLDAGREGKFAYARVAITGGATTDGWIVFYDFPQLGGGGSVDEIGTTTTRTDRSSGPILSDFLGEEVTVWVAACDDLSTGTGSVVPVPWGEQATAWVPCAEGAALSGWVSDTRTYVEYPDVSCCDVRQATRRILWEIPASMTGPGWIAPTGWVVRYARADGASDRRAPGAPWRKVELGPAARSAVLGGAGSGYWVVRITMQSAYGPLAATGAGVYFR